MWSLVMMELIQKLMLFDGIYYPGTSVFLVLSSFIKFYLSTIFCLVYFLSMEDPIEHTFFTNLKIVNEAGT
jgi:hypothetical protein